MYCGIEKKKTTKEKEEKTFIKYMILKLIKGRIPVKSNYIYTKAAQFEKPIFLFFKLEARDVLIGIAKEMELCKDVSFLKRIIKA
jgi:hypothetical protein